MPGLMLTRHRLWLIALSFLLIGLLGVAGAGEVDPGFSPPSETPGSGDPVVAVAPVPEKETHGQPEPVGPDREALLPSDDGGGDLPDPSLSPFPVETNGAVQHFVERFQTGSRREVIGRWLDRSTRYLGMIQEVLRKKGLPEDLAFTAMVESGFNPVAVSRAGAKGLWQFMEQTARRYGLRVDRWVDERLDPEKSTEAAAEHLKDLFERFGHWFLAQAAYNAGEVKVARAVERARSNDFWTIARGRWLREETKQFVPQIQAAALIAREPERYGFQVNPEPPMVYEVVSVLFSVELRKLAALADLAPDTLRELNPELRRGVTPPGRSYFLKVPTGSVALVADALEQIEAQRYRAAKSQAVRARKTSAHPPAAGMHVVKPRDTLSEIAQRYGVTVSELVRLNGLDPEARIYPGDQIRVAVSILPSERELTP